jgi:hypothetical protein
MNDSRSTCLLNPGSGRTVSYFTCPNPEFPHLTACCPESTFEECCFPENKKGIDLIIQEAFIYLWTQQTWLFYWLFAAIGGGLMVAGIKFINDPDEEPNKLFKACRRFFKCCCFCLPCCGIPISFLSPYFLKFECKLCKGRIPYRIFDEGQKKGHRIRCFQIASVEYTGIYTKYRNIPDSTKYMCSKHESPLKMWPKDDLKGVKCAKCKEKSENSDIPFHLCFLCDSALCGDHFDAEFMNLHTWSVVNFNNLNTFTTKPKPTVVQPQQPSLEPLPMVNPESPHNPPPYNLQQPSLPLPNPQNGCSTLPTYEPEPSVYNPSVYNTAFSPPQHSVPQNNIFSANQNNISANQNNISVPQNNISSANQNNISANQNNISVPQNNISSANQPQQPYSELPPTYDESLKLSLSPC